MTPEHLLDLGIAVIPILNRDKKPALHWREYQTRLPSRDELKEWQKHRFNWAAVCGWLGLTVLDFDTFDAYGLWYNWATATQGIASEVAQKTYRVVTARGVHVYLFVQNPVSCSHQGLIDVKGKGGYVLIPPSVHPCGVPYKPLVNGTNIMTVERIDQVLPARQDTAERRERSESPWKVAEQARGLNDIGQDLVAAIKARFSPLDFLPPAERTGYDERWWITRCPFHADRHPSFWVDAEAGTCGCYAGCTPKVLDVINLFAKLNNINNREAILELSRRNAL